MWKLTYIGYSTDDLRAAIEADIFPTHALKRDASVVVMPLDNRVIWRIEFELYHEVQSQRLARPSGTQAKSWTYTTDSGREGKLTRHNLPTTSPTLASVTFGSNLNPLYRPVRGERTNHAVCDAYPANLDGMRLRLGLFAGGRRLVIVGLSLRKGAAKGT